MPVTAAQVQNVKLGACSVTYNAIDLGLTKGGVSVSITTDVKNIQVDQFGQSVVNSYIMGRSATVKVPMAESDLSKLQAVIPGSTLVTDKTTTSKKKLVIPTGTGISLFGTAMPLVLHPTANAAGNVAEDLTALLAAPTGNLTFDYQVENERIYQVEFMVYPDPTTNALLMIGDSTASAT